MQEIEAVMAQKEILGARLVHVIVFVIVILQNSCGTLSSRFDADPYEYGLHDLKYPKTKIYGGVVADIYEIRYESRSKTTSNMPVLLDIPLSFAADTLLLPLTVYEQFFTGTLAEAAEKGDITAVKMILEKGEDVDAKDGWGHTPLMSAAWGGDNNIVLILLEKGAAINAKTKQGSTPLFYAVFKGHTATTQSLLDHGADPNSKGRSEETPLLKAAGTGDKEIVDALIAKGADVNARGWLQFTPLMHAAKGGYTEIVQTLLNKGADVNAKDNTGGTALLYAACAGREETVAFLLLNGADVTAKRLIKPDHPSNSPLGCAIHTRHTAIAERLRAEGATN